jgi:hypothetical protein
MDWQHAIEKNREALKRVLAGIMAMAGLGTASTSPLWGGRRSSDRRVGVVVGIEPPPDASRRPPHKGEVKPELTLPRLRYLAVLRLLRPAESAARRLVIAASRGIVVTLPPPRPRKAGPDIGRANAVLGRLGIAVMGSRDGTAHARAAAARAGIGRDASRVPRFRLTDPLPRFFRRRRRSVPDHLAPRVRSFDSARQYSVPPRPPGPNDPIDASRLGRRLASLGRVLDDLPGEARRFARWRAHRDRAAALGRRCRVGPLRPGRPPGGRPVRGDPDAPRGRNVREVDVILAAVHGLAREALERPDTS